MIRRETIIALRARHTAFRIAIDFLYPQQPAPPLPQPVIPIVDIDGPMTSTLGKPHRPKRLLAIVLVVLAMLWLFLLVCGMLNSKDLWEDVPPAPPQGRPILQN